MSASLDKKDAYNHYRKKSLVGIAIILFYTNKKQNYVFLFFYTVQVDAAYQKILYSSCLLLFLRHETQKTREHILNK